MSKKKELTEDQIIELTHVGVYTYVSVPDVPALPDGWKWDPELEAEYMDDPPVFVYAAPSKLLEARVDMVERAHKVEAAYKAMLRKEKEEES